MRERIVMAGVVVAALACVVTAVVAWTAVRQSQAVNHAVLAKLDAMGSQAEVDSIAPDWGKLIVRLREGTGNGPPVAGVEVELDGDAFGTGRCTLRETTDVAGAASFGPLRPGHFTLKTIVRGLKYEDRQLTVYPGRAQEFDVACPSADVWTRLTVRVEWPEEIPEGNIGVFLDLEPVDLRHRIGDHSWRVPNLRVTVSRDNRLLEGPVADEGGCQYRPIHPFGGSADQQNPTGDCALGYAFKYRLWQLTVWRGSTDSMGRTGTRSIAGDAFSLDAAPVYHTAPGASCGDSTWTVEIPPSLAEKVIAAAAESEADKPAGTP